MCIEGMKRLHCRVRIDRDGTVASSEEEVRRWPGPIEAHFICLDVLGK